MFNLGGGEIILILALLLILVLVPAIIVGVILLLIQASRKTGNVPAPPAPSARNSPPDKLVMVKCPSCGKLNDQDAKFCQECGRKL